VVSALLAVVAQVLHLALVLAAAPVLAGVVAWLEARMQGRAGPPVLQPWHDMARALRRQPVVAEGTSWLFRAAPVLRLAVLVVAAALVPSFSRHMALMPAGDLVAIVGLLALARAVAALAALDEGGALAGQDAARGLARGAMAEPALLLVVFALALAAGGTGLAAVLGMRAEDALGWQAASLPLALALLLAAAADDTSTGPTPELSGRLAALAAAADALRLTVWLALVAVLFVPPFLPPARPDPALVLGDWLVFVPVWLAKMGLLAMVVAAARTLGLWPRAVRVPGLLGMAALLAVLGVAMLFAGQRLR